ncbi:MAG: hypothetical protein IAE90_04715 [Ignavibacteria bacterium]|nr:hypothetical protein [Ignavibacteria bacterium]
MKSVSLIYRIHVLLVATVVSMAVFYGCGDSTTTPTQADNLSFSGVSSDDSVGDAQNYLILDTVKILIKDIKINYANTSDDSTDFKVGPFVLFLNLTSNVNVISTGIVPAGNYKKIKFEIHKLQDAEVIPDPEFADANGRYSVIVKGKYFGNYFVYKSTKSAHQILNFPSDIGVAADRSTNVTLLVKPYIWFIKNGAYLDPFNPDNSNDIDNNIKDNINNNFKAFRDNDKNGQED